MTEKPDVDAAARPFSGVNATVHTVEVGAVGVGKVGLDVAAEVSLAVTVGKGTAAAGMHGHLVSALRVDALDDVDFARVGPIGASHPEGGPGATDATGHVRKVYNDESVGI